MGIRNALMLFEMDFLPPSLKSVGWLNVGVFDNATKVGILSVVSRFWLGLTGDWHEMDSAASLAQRMVLVR